MTRRAWEELSLWDAMPPPDPPPTTADPMSRAAADSIAALAGAVRRRVAEYVNAHEPVAEWTIERELGLSGNTVRPRLWELMRADLVETAGRGITPSGRECHLYRLTPAGRVAIATEP
jgi:predicted ArsR family transcriptional regulator